MRQTLRICKECLEDWGLRQNIWRGWSQKTFSTFALGVPHHFLSDWALQCWSKKGQGWWWRRPKCRTWRGAAWWSWKGCSQTAWWRRTSWRAGYNPPHPPPPHHHHHHHHPHAWRPRTGLVVAGSRQHSSCASDEAEQFLRVLYFSVGKNKQSCVFCISKLALCFPSLIWLDFESAWSSTSTLSCL